MKKIFFPLAILYNWILGQNKTHKISTATIRKAGYNYGIKQGNSYHSEDFIAGAEWRMRNPKKNKRQKAQNYYETNNYQSTSLDAFLEGCDFIDNMEFNIINPKPNLN